MKKTGLVLGMIIMLTWFMSGMASASSEEQQDVLEVRRLLFDQMSAMTGIPWYHYAAIDQYERTIRQKQDSETGKLTAMEIAPDVWAGRLNPNPQDRHPLSIRWFQGIGLDGNGDGIADPHHDIDVLYTLSRQLGKYGISRIDWTRGIWAFYHNPRSVRRIQQFSKIYASFGRLDLNGHAFPVPIRSDHSYRDTWGAARGWGGYRIHEGTDIFAGYGVPVRSTSFGIIEMMGWNRFGGWRIGIRDIHNIYHYYAHLQGFNKAFKVGSVLKPGDTIGWVGSSGYGKPGTQGKFPPHLHYGMYKDSGLTDWAFDPYPALKRWEREERSSRH